MHKVLLTEPNVDVENHLESLEELFDESAKKQIPNEDSTFNNGSRVEQTKIGQCDEAELKRKGTTSSMIEAEFISSGMEIESEEGIN